MLPQSVIAYVGIGSNMKDPVHQVLSALRELDEVRDTRLLRSSSLYATDPIGLVGQARFVNAVAAVDTSLSPEALLDALLAIEQRHGRVRAEKNGPRTLDLDILLYGARQVQQPGLTVPHPEMHKRAFVLEPLLEVDPECEIPGLGRAAAFRESVAGQGASRMTA